MEVGESGEATGMIGLGEFGQKSQRRDGHIMDFISDRERRGSCDGDECDYHNDDDNDSDDEMKNGDDNGYAKVEGESKGVKEKEIGKEEKRRERRGGGGGER